MPESDQRYRYLGDFSNHTGILSITKNGAGTADCKFYGVKCPIQDGIGVLSLKGDIYSQSYTLDEIKNAFNHPFVAVKRMRNGLSLPLNRHRYNALAVECGMPTELVLKGIKNKERDGFRIPSTRR